MNGRALADRLVAFRPNIKVLFMSGYPAAAVAPHGALDPGTQLLEKPFTPGSLARKVREVLDTP
jgi:CheY-like chemotaxis protein